jgi:hypothetical protein
MLFADTIRATDCGRGHRLLPVQEFNFGGHVSFPECKILPGTIAGYSNVKKKQPACAVMWIS